MRGRNTKRINKHRNVKEAPLDQDMVTMMLSVYKLKATDFKFNDAEIAQGIEDFNKAEKEAFGDGAKPIADAQEAKTILSGYRMTDRELRLLTPENREAQMKWKIPGDDTGQPLRESTWMLVTGAEIFAHNFKDVKYEGTGGMSGHMADSTLYIAKDYHFSNKKLQAQKEKQIAALKAKKEKETATTSS